MASFAHSPGRLFLYLLRDAAVRTGVYVGLAFSLVFTAWLFMANSMPVFDGLAAPRNITAACLLGLIASIPVLRFFRSPAEMLLSSVIGWGISTLTYGSLCLKFSLLEQHYSTFEVFVLGAIVYLLLATLSWIGTIIWRVRAASSSHPRD